MVIVAVKVTEVPAHIVPTGLTAILIVGTTGTDTCMVMLLLVSVGGVAQVALLVSVQVITSLLASAAFV